MDRYDPWLERLSEYLDGDLDPAARLALEAHLEECADCRAILAELRAVVTLAGRLEDQAPAQDLWPAIRDRVRVAGVSGAGAERHRPRWRFSFALPQLAAACLALTLLAGGTGWFLGVARSPTTMTSSLPAPGATGSATGGAPAAGTGPATGAGSGPGTEAGPATARFASDLIATQYDAAITDLERILAEGRGQLAPATIAILEENLAIIDRAIEEARRAIAADPGNLYLTNYLTDTMKRKLELLRYTNSIVRAQS